MLFSISGKVKRINVQNHPDQKTWQDGWDTAWVPQNCGMDRSGKEENCVKSVDQITVLGVCHGWEHLDSETQQLPGLRKVDSVQMTPEEWTAVDDLKSKYDGNWTDFDR